LGLIYEAIGWIFFVDFSIDVN